MEKLARDYKKIINSEEKIKKLEKLKENLVKQKEKYYAAYFNSYFKDWKGEDFYLENFPLYDWKEYFDKSYRAFEPYSKMNVLLVGDFIKQLLNTEGKQVDSKLIILDLNKEVFYGDHYSATIPTKIPCVMIGKDLDKKYTMDDFETTDNIIITLKNYEYKKSKDFFIEGTERNDNDYKVFYSTSQELIGFNYTYYKESKNKKYTRSELVFDSKGHKCIRELIFGIAAYQRQNQITQLDDDELVRVFKKTLYKKYQY